MNRFLPNLLGMLLGTAIGFTEALFLGVVPYLGFDAVKLVLGMAFGSQVRKRLLQAGLL